MKFSRLHAISLPCLFLTLLLTACGGGGGDDEIDPIVLDFVLALFTTNGADWNDYLAGSDFASATDTACIAATDPACVHGGELRVVEVTGRNSCAGLTASDDLAAFNWICDDSTNPVRMISLGLAEGMYLSDLIDFTAIAFRENAITVFLNGSVYGKSRSSVWWGNTVGVIDPNSFFGITLVTSDPQAALVVNTSKSALVVEPGLTITGPGTNLDVITNNNPDHLWIEGSIDAGGDATGVQIITSNYSVLRNVSVKNSNGEGIDLVQFRNGRLEDIRVSNNASTGLLLRANDPNRSDNNSITNVVASNNGSNGIAMILSDNNTLTGLTLSNTPNGIFLDIGDNNRFAGVTAHHNGFGIRAFSSRNRNNVFTGVSTMNNQWGVLLPSNLTIDNTFSNLAAANNDIGIVLEGSNRTLLADVATSNNNTGINLDTSDDNTFTGTLQVGNNLTSDCTVIAGNNPGLVDTTCAVQGSSFHVLTNGISLANSFVGKVTTEDLQNLADTNGAVVGFPGTPALFDWAVFDNRYRGWGIDGSAFPNADHRRRWATGGTDAGRIWDWSVSSGDTGNGGNPALLDVNVLPNGIDTLFHSWFGAPVSNDNAGCDALVTGSLWNGAECETEFLRNAVEIPQDGIGNDNNLCETGETCLFMPNIGSYQGHGNLVSAGAFINGALTGITLMRYATNGR